MHELAVTQGILNVALTAAEQAGAQAITRIDLVIGDLSSIVDDSVQFYFDIISKGTPAENATLSFRRIPAVLTCCDCEARHEVVAPLPPFCPQCQSTRLIVQAGREFYVESIDIVDDDVDVDIEENEDESTSRQIHSY